MDGSVAVDAATATTGDREGDVSKARLELPAQSPERLPPTRHPRTGSNQIVEEALVTHDSVVTASFRTLLDQKPVLGPADVATDLSTFAWHGDHPLSLR